jgi:hypothetical protein
MKTSLKWKNLIRPYYDLQIYAMNSKKGTKIYVPFFYFIRKIWSLLQGRIRLIFFISLAFSYLNFKKVDIRGTEEFGTTESGIVTIWRIFLAFWSCRPESASMSWWFPAEFHSSGVFLIYELGIPGGKQFLRWLPSHWAGNLWRNNHSSGGFLALELVILVRITLYKVLPRTATFAITIPSGGFLVLERVIPGRITFYSVLLQTASFAVFQRWVWQISLQEILRTVTVPRLIILKSSLPPNPIFV